MTIEATIDGQLVRWRDSKRYLWILGAIMPLLPFAMWGLFALTGSTAAWFFGPFFVFVLIPIFDADGRARSRTTRRMRSSSPSRRTATTAGSPTCSSRCSSIGLVWGAYLLGGGTLPGIEDPLTVLQKIGLATGLGMVAGIGINTAHELGHKKQQAGALGRPRGAGADVLRPLLHRAQPRPPRARGDTARPGERPPRRDRLGVPAPHVWGSLRSAWEPGEASGCSGAASRPGGSTAT